MSVASRVFLLNCTRHFRTAPRELGDKIEHFNYLGQRNVTGSNFLLNAREIIRVTSKSGIGDSDKILELSDDQSIGDVPAVVVNRVR